MRVLLVEDDDAQAEIVTAQLTGSLSGEVVVCRAARLAQALDALADGWDVVLLDLGLPDSHGLVGLEHLLSADSAPPVVVLTGQHDLTLALAAVGRGAQDFVQKSVAGGGGDALSKSVLYAVERHRLRSDLEAKTALLLDSQASFASIAANGDGMLVIGLDDRVRWANAAAAALFGTPRPESLVGTRLDRPLAEGTDTELEVGGRVLQIRVANTTWDGVDAVLASARDITRQRETELQLLEAQRLTTLGRLTAGVAHQFSNVLTGLLGTADLLRSTVAHNPSSMRLIEALERDLSFAARLTRQLRSFGRQQVISTEPIELNLLVERSADLFARLVGDDVRLELDLATGLPAVQADPAQLELALFNLVANARAATARGGRIRVTTRRSHRSAELTISDDGEGMAPDVLAQAREPFFTTRERDLDGGPKPLGLGLSTVYDIVERTGGSVAIESRLGHGTTVRVTLRASHQTPISERLAAGAPRTGARPTETVLVVDDEAVIRDLLRRVLEREGYTVLVAASGPAAIDKVLGYAGPLDLLLTDVMMPEMHGAELAATLSGIRRDLPVLFMSGYEERIVAPTGVLADGVSFLEKPFRMELALKTVRQVLDWKLRQDRVSSFYGDPDDVAGHTP